MNHVLIGGGCACISCAQNIRYKDKDASITIVSGEKYLPYGRPSISYYLAGILPEGKMEYRDEEFYLKNNITLLKGVKATNIDPLKKEVPLDNGQTLPYDKLFLGTGSIPFIPKTQGYESVKGSFTFMTRADAERLNKAVSKDSTVLVIGAGLIGLKCVEGIAEKAGKVICVDLADRVLSSILDDECAKVFQDLLESHGVEFILSDCVEKYTGNTVHLKSGKDIPFDVLVSAVGVKAETSLALQAGCKVNKGVVVNTYMETSVKDIYCGGDCAEGYDSSLGTDRILAIMPNANLQGEIAGKNMAKGVGEEKAQLLNAVPMNAIGFYGLHVLSCGVYEGECIIKKDGVNLKKLYIKDGHLSGFMLIGDFLRAGIYTSLIRGKTPLDTVDMELLKDEPQLLAFSKEYRKDKLTRKV